MQKMLFMSVLTGHVNYQLLFFFVHSDFGTDAEIIDLIGDNEYFRNTLEKDNTETTEKALIEIYERLRPGEPPTLDSAKNLIVLTFL